MFAYFLYLLISRNALEQLKVTITIPPIQPHMKKRLVHMHLKYVQWLRHQYLD